MIVYGDFNCPYSRLASDRVDVLLARGADVEWRAVQHDPSIPTDGVAVAGDLRAELEREVAEIEGLLAPHEQVRLEIGDVRPNTALDTRTFAALVGAEAHAFRRARMEEIWAGRHADRPEVEASDLAVAWQSAWEAVPDRMVPLLIDDAGEITRGIDALNRLRALVAG